MNRGWSTNQLVLACPPVAALGRQMWNNSYRGPPTDPLFPARRANRHVMPQARASEKPAVICPNCLTEQPEWVKVCPDCEASLAFLQEHPRRVSLGVWMAMLAGLALLIALLSQVLDELLAGGFPTLGVREGIELAFGITLSVLGSRAWVALKYVILRCLPSWIR